MGKRYKIPKMLEAIQCDHCKKMFIPAAQHMYKLQVQGRSTIYCSYTCYRTIQKELEKGK